MQLDKSFFTTTTVHAKQVTLSDGTTHTLYFRELGGHEFIRYRQELQAEDLDVSARAVPHLIANSLCNEDGSPAIDVAKALMLKAEPMQAIMGALMEVNTFSAKKSSPSAAGNGSATS